jgi:hypothetical protein
LNGAEGNDWCQMKDSFRCLNKRHRGWIVLCVTSVFSLCRGGLF